MSGSGAPSGTEALRPRRRQASVAWQLALAQEFGQAYPFEWDAASGLVTASAALKALFGVPASGELTAERVMKAVDPADHEAIARRAAAIVRDGGRFETEFRITLVDGVPRWVLVRGRALASGRRGRIAGVGVDITRRKRAEQALAEKEAALLASEARFRAAQETSIDGFMMIEAVRDGAGQIIDFRWIYTNDAAERILGRPREWFIGRRLLQEMPGAADAGLFEAYVDVVETGAPWSRELSYAHEGLDVYLRVVAGKVGDSVAVTLADLSDRRRAEQSVIAAEERWRAILNTMPQMVWSTLPDGSHDFFNDRWYEFTGVRRGSTEGKGWAGVFHPDDQPEAWRRWQHSLATGEPYQIEYRLRHHSGRWRWTLGRAVPLKGPDGTVERWFGTCTDIDDIKATEARLRTSEQRLQLALDAAEVVGTWDWDIAADRIIPDTRLARLFGIDPEAAQSGSRFADFLAGVHPEDRKRLEEAVDHALKSGEALEIEYRVVRPDGTVTWLSARGQYVQEDSDAIRFPGVAIDITERKEIEEARELLARELSHRIKNIFAVVNSLVTLSARGNEAAKPFAETVRARLTALGRAHDYVRPSLDEGPAADGQTAHGLFSALLAPYRDEDDPRIIVEGCDAPVGVRAATALALVVHELATNAVKYGALSADTGRVRVRCRSERDSYRLLWEERGGPAITGAPDRRGYGTLMSERTASAQLGAIVEHDWSPQGLTVSIVMPLAELAQ